jgi:hypothetical protein
MSVTVNNLLTRRQFREAVFARDGNKCVACSGKAQDAHHIIERRLWGDGGYYLNNGASLCGPCHMDAEKTLLSVEAIRAWAGITKVVVPEHLYKDHRYDKWGNPYLGDGIERCRGELFNDPSVQKVLGDQVQYFTHYVKYPRTYHLPWSPGVTSDDRVLQDISCFEGKEVVVTVKMDGENTTMYSDYIHARSINSRRHPSRDWVKNFHGKIGGDIPEGWRLVVENCYAAHSIRYKNLSSYVYGISLWNSENFCLGWHETLEWFELLGLVPVPVLYHGVWDTQAIKDLYTQEHRGDECEGYVVRLAEEFDYGAFNKSVGKFVRQNHIQTHGHWMRSSFRPNSIKKF